jgi:hypothetical protein
MAQAGDRTLKCRWNTGAAWGGRPNSERRENRDERFQAVLLPTDHGYLGQPRSQGPAVKDQVTKDPSKLQQYGFTNIPSKVTFQASDAGSGGVKGYDDQLTDYVNGGAVTFYVPPAPKGGAAEDTSYCCCCCPCCTCT